MHNSFSIKYKFEIIDNTLQLTEMNDRLRNRLLNQLRLFLSVINNDYHRYNKGNWPNFIFKLFDEFFGEMTKNHPATKNALHRIMATGETLEFNKLYDFLTFTYDNLFQTIEDKKKFQVLMNLVLTEENSGYRIINGSLIAITDKIELKELETSLDINSKNDLLSGISIHIANAIYQLNRTNPDFRNSIKESISAVECATRFITGENTLGNGLKKLKKNGLINNNTLKDGFEKLYVYTNDKKTGIRHALMEGSETPDFNTAKYMLVSCSAFSNYLINLAN